MSGAADKKTKFVFTNRWIPQKSEGGRIYLSGSYWVTDHSSIGFDYRPLTNELSLTTLHRLMSESRTEWGGWKPAVMMGSTADDFSDNGTDVQSRTAFITLSKALPKFDSLNLVASPYVGAVWIHELSEVRPLAGLNLRHGDTSFLIQYSGTDTHLTLSQRIDNNLSLSLVYWGLKYPGVSARIKF